MTEKIALFLLDNQKYFALKTCDIQRIEPAVALVTVPDMPPEMIGYINVHGNYGAVFDLNILFGSNPAETIPSDFVILFTISEHSFAGIQVHELPEILDAEISLIDNSSHDQFAGIANTGSQMALILSPSYFENTKLPPIPSELFDQLIISENKRI